MTDMDFLKELAEEAGKEASPEGALEHAQKLAAEVNAINQRVETLETDLSALKSRRWNILTKELVEVLDQAKIDAVTVDGIAFQAGPYYKASIPEEHRDQAHNWLEDHDAGDLIKRTITVEFPKDATEESAALIRYIRERYQMADVEEKRLVPWKRLTSWLQELYESRTVDTVIPPLDIFGATVGRVVQIKKKRK